MTQVQSPFQLHVIIHRAEGLPIADYTSSDPFVSIFLDDKEVGRTHTIYKNLSPTWNSTFEHIPVRSILDTELILRIYDEDQWKSDDILGMVKVSLSDLPLNEKVEFYQELLQVGQKIIAKGIISFSLELKQDKYMVHITKYLESGDISMKSSSSKSLLNIMDDLDSVDKWTLSDPVVKTLNEYSILADDPNIHAVLHDILSDMASILRPLSFGQSLLDDDYDMMDTSNLVVRRGKGMFCSTSINLESDSNTYHRVQPLPFLGVRLLLKPTASESWSSLSIEIGSKHVTWMFVKWIRIAYKYWNDELSEAELESYHLNSHDFRFFGTASISPDFGLYESTTIAGAIGNNAITNTIGNTTIGSAIGTIGSTAIGIGTIPIGMATSAIGSVVPTCPYTGLHLHGVVSTWIGAVILSLNKPYTLEVYDIGSKQLLCSFSIKDLSSIQVAVDSLPPSDFSLILDVKSCDYQTSLTSNNDRQSPQNTASPQKTVTDVDFGPKGLIGFRRFVRKTAYKTGTAIQSSAGLVSHTVLGVTTGAVSTVSNVATGAAKGIISTAADAARTIATGDPRLAISSAHRAVLGYGKDIVNMVASTGVIVHGLFNYPISYVIIKHGVHIYYALIPVDTASIWDCRVVIDLKNDQILSFLHATSVDESSDDSIDIFLYNGIIGSESLISQRNIKISKFLSKMSSLSASSLSSPHHGSDVKVTLHSELGLFVSILNGRGIMLPQQQKVGGMFVKCKLVDNKGKSLTLPPSSHVETQHTKTIPSHSNPDWKGGDQIFLGTKDGMDRASYVRLQILGGLPVNPDTLGFILIPIEDFTSKVQERFYPVMKYKRLTGIGGSGGEYGHGELRVKFQKIVDRTYSSPQATNTASSTSVKISPMLVMSNVYQSVYPADAILSGHIESYNGQPINSMESMFVSITSSDYLLLIDSDALSSLKESDTRFEGSQVQNNPDMMTSRDTFVAHPSPSTRNATKQSSPSSSASPSPHNMGLRSLDEHDIDPASMPLLRRASSSTINEISQPSIVEHIELAIFENQRRQIYPPYDWSNGNLFSSERKQFSDELGTKNFAIESLSSALPPSGYEWSSDWRVDKKYTPTDEYGWTFGNTFKDIMSNYGNGVKSISPTLKTVRRRKWVRSARYNHDISTLIIDATNDVRVSSSLPFRPVPTLMSNNISERPSITSRRPTIMSRVSLTDNWRQEEYSSKKHAGSPSILSTSKERSHYGGPVKIPWENVLHASIITDGILCLKLLIHRYFGLNTNDEGNSSNTAEEKYREAIVDLFIMTCPAAELKIAIDERIQYDKFRVKVKDIIVSGSTAGSNDSIQDPKDSQVDAPDTVELSLGAEMMSRLERDASSLDARIIKLQDQVGSSTIKNSNKEVLVLAKRALRLRLYQASLLAANLSTLSLPTFTEEAARATVANDILSIRRIVHNDEVSTVNNQIEYLLDVAESRLCDATLTGWNYRESTLLPILEIYTNRYLLEMVHLLSKFFITRNMEALKGLQSKITLISTFTSHNDRLAEILQIALTRYDPTSIVIQPKPRLSLFLEFGQLLSWYAIVLQQDMKRVVNNALSVWRDKDAVGRGENYTYVLPWIPMRQRGQHGAFLSLLPEDTVNYLNKYLEFSRLRKEDMAESLADSIAEVDGRVALSYALSFEVLIEAYWMELSSKKWNMLIFNHQTSDANNDHINELEEQCEWLCSVANDARRIVHDTMINKELDRQKSSSNANSAVPNERDIAVVTARSYSVLNKTMTRALDYISCIIFYEASFHYNPPFDTQMNFLDDRFTGLWLTYASNYNDDDNTGTTSSPSLMTDHLNNLKEVLSGRIDSLDRLSYMRLITICIDKIIIRFFYILRDLHIMKRHFVYDSAEIRCYIHDKDYAVKIFESLFDDCGISEYRDLVHSSFKRLDQATVLLSSISEESPEFISTLKSLGKIASGRPAESLAIAEMIAVCVDLRQPVNKLSPARRASTRPVEKRPSIFGSLLSSASSSLSSPTYDNKPAHDHTDELLLSPAHHTIQNIRDMFDESDIPSLDEYEGMLCNPILDVSPGETSKLTAPVVKVFYLADRKESSSRYIFNLRSFILDSVYHNQDILSNKQLSLSTSTPVKYVASLFRGIDSMKSSTMPSIAFGAGNDHDDGLNEEPSTIVVSNIRVFNAYCLDLGRKPSIYVSVSMVESTSTYKPIMTSIKKDTVDPDWSDDDPIYIPVSSSSITTKRILVSVHYKNRWYGDEVFGSVEIPLLTLDISPIQHRDFDLDVTTASTRAQAAQKLALENSVPLTRIRISIALLSH